MGSRRRDETDADYRRRHATEQAVRRARTSSGRVSRDEAQALSAPPAPGVSFTAAEMLRDMQECLVHTHANTAAVAKRVSEKMRRRVDGV